MQLGATLPSGRRTDAWRHDGDVSAQVAADKSVRWKKIRRCSISNRQLVNLQRQSHAGIDTHSASMTLYALFCFDSQDNFSAPPERTVRLNTLRKS